MRPSAKLAKHSPGRKPWWGYRRNRTKVWTGLLVVVLVGSFGGVLWAVTKNSTSNPGTTTAGTVPTAQKVEAVKLEDSRTGGMFDLGEYLGRKDIVLVAYMGDF